MTDKNSRKRRAIEKITGLVSAEVDLLFGTEPAARKPRTTIEAAVSSELGAYVDFSDIKVTDLSPREIGQYTQNTHTLVSATMETSVSGWVYKIKIVVDFATKKVTTSLDLIGKRNYSADAVVPLDETETIAFTLSTDKQTKPILRRLLPFTVGLNHRIAASNYEAARAFRVIDDALVDAAADKINAVSADNDEDIDDKIATAADLLRRFIHEHTTD